MELLRVPTLCDQIDVFQMDRAQVHINAPFADHSLQREVPQVILEGQTMLCAELDQRVSGFTIPFLIGDGNGEFDILLWTRPTMPTRRIPGAYSVLVLGEALQLI